jgi:hypothetical protein
MEEFTPLLLPLVFSICLSSSRLPPSCRQSSSRLSHGPAFVLCGRTSGLALWGGTGGRLAFDSFVRERVGDLRFAGKRVGDLIFLGEQVGVIIWLGMGDLPLVGDLVGDMDMPLLLLSRKSSRSGLSTPRCCPSPILIHRKDT